ncbi:hypothetical protein WICMUC_003651 [Wickerhamomyces mucosus]|uniref:Phosphoribulokinase/uridine kinase domain-containing protein n=1 Tax=Wickerhamomyces mucosus TaxID=1378264 RepID=A0A9P8PLN9_9ASCO|nr:hypothetical protein WICMUC_003651 [Wickerhamomyces mucosus]
MSGTEVIVPIESTTRKRRESRIASLDRVSFLLDSGNEAKHSTLHTDKETYVPPWTEPYIIGIAGPSGSGKTSVASKIIQAINTPWTVLISLDNYYKPLTPEERKLAFQSKWDFDTPDAIDLDLCYQTVKALKEG